MKLLFYTFHKWVEDTKEQLWQKWALTTEEQFKQRKCTRKAFLGWKGTCMFLQWHSRFLESAALKADHHFKRTLLSYWRQISRQSRHCIRWVRLLLLLLLIILILWLVVSLYLNSHPPIITSHYLLLPLTTSHCLSLPIIFNKCLMTSLP